MFLTERDIIAPWQKVTGKRRLMGKQISKAMEGRANASEDPCCIPQKAPVPYKHSCLCGEYWLGCMVGGCMCSYVCMWVSIHMHVEVPCLCACWHVCGMCTRMFVRGMCWREAVQHLCQLRDPGCIVTGSYTGQGAWAMCTGMFREACHKTQGLLVLAISIPTSGLPHPFEPRCSWALSRG